jgi:hypothetical protein
MPVIDVDCHFDVAFGAAAMTSWPTGSRAAPAAYSKSLIADPAA